MSNHPCKYDDRGIAFLILLLFIIGPCDDASERKQDQIIQKLDNAQVRPQPTECKCSCDNIDTCVNLNEN